MATFHNSAPEEMADIVSTSSEIVDEETGVDASEQKSASSWFQLRYKAEKSCGITVFNSRILFLIEW